MTGAYLSMDDKRNVARPPKRLGRHKFSASEILLWIEAGIKWCTLEYKNLGTCNSARQLATYFACSLGLSLVWSACEWCLLSKRIKLSFLVTSGTRKLCCFVISRSFKQKLPCPEYCGCIDLLYDHLVRYSFAKNSSQETTSAATYSEEFKRCYTTSLKIVLEMFKLVMKTEEGEWMNVTTNEQLKAAFESDKLFCKIGQNWATA